MENGKPEEGAGYEISYVWLSVRPSEPGGTSAAANERRTWQIDACRRAENGARRGRGEKDSTDSTDRIGNLIERAGRGAWADVIGRRLSTCLWERFKVEFRKAKSSGVICPCDMDARNLHARAPDKYRLVSCSYLSIVRWHSACLRFLLKLIFCKESYVV